MNNDNYTFEEQTFSLLYPLVCVRVRDWAAENDPFVPEGVPFEVSYVEFTVHRLMNNPEQRACFFARDFNIQKQKDMVEFYCTHVDKRLRAQEARRRQECITHWFG